MRVGDILEWFAGAAFVAGAYLATSLTWTAVIAFALVLAYFGQRQRPAWLAHLATLRLKPGDVLVARIPARLPVTEFEATTQKVRREFPGVHVVVIPNTMELAKIDMQALNTKPPAQSQ